MKLWLPIAVAALVAGVADLIYACVHFPMINPANTPMGIIQSIGAGWIGSKAAAEGGTATLALGVFSEFFLTTIMAAVYIVAAQWITDLRKFWWVLGPAYGLCVMIVMYSVVLPLAANHGGPNLPDGSLTLANCTPSKAGTISPARCTGQDHQTLYGTILVHLLIIGLPIGAAARYLWPAQKAEPLGA
jgi:hypothetical protein